MSASEGAHGPARLLVLVRRGRCGSWLRERRLAGSEGDRDPAGRTVLARSRMPRPSTSSPRARNRRARSIRPSSSNGGRILSLRRSASSIKRSASSSWLASRLSAPSVRMASKRPTWCSELLVDVPRPERRSPPLVPRRKLTELEEASRPDPQQHRAGDWVGVTESDIACGDT